MTGGSGDNVSNMGSCCGDDSTPPRIDQVRLGLVMITAIRSGWENQMSSGELFKRDSC